MKIAVNRSTPEQCAQELKKQAVNRMSASTSAPLRSVPLKGVRIRDSLMECRNKKATFPASTSANNKDCYLISNRTLKISQ